MMEEYFRRSLLPVARRFLGILQPALSLALLATTALLVVIVALRR